MSAIDYAQIANIYDLIVTFDDDIPYFKDVALTRRGPVLELMCGTGRVSLPLIEAGIDLTCVDASPDMLRVLRNRLRKRGVTANVVQADVCKLRLDREFDLVILPFQSFAELVTRDEQSAALESIRGVMTETGRFVCTLHNPSVRLRDIDGEKRKVACVSAPDGREVTLETQLFYDEDAGHVSGYQWLDIMDASGKRRPRREMRIRFPLHDRDGFERLAEGAGFVVEMLHGDYDGSPYHPETSRYMIWTLRR